MKWNVLRMNPISKNVTAIMRLNQKKNDQMGNNTE